MRTLPLGTLAISVTAQTRLHESGSGGGDWTTDGSGVWSSLPHPVGEGVTESDRRDCVCVLYLNYNKILF